MNYCSRLIILVIFCGIVKSKFLEGPYEVDIKYARACEKNNEHRFKFFVTTKKFNRTHVGIDMNATVSAEDEFDEKYKLDIELRIWSDGGWKRNFFRFKRNNACTTLNMLLGPIWEKVTKAAGIKKGCPIRKGYYSFENYFIDLSACKLIIRKGRFYVIVKALTHSNIVGECLEGELEIN